MTGFQIFYATNAFLWFLMFLIENSRKHEDFFWRVIFAVASAFAFARCLYEFS